MFCVAINAESLTYRKAGVGYYTYNLVANLANIKKSFGCRLLLFAKKDDPRMVDLSDLDVDRVCYIRPIVDKFLSYDRAKVLSIEGLFLDSCLTNESIDVYHEPNHILLDVKAKKKIVTVHDLATIYVPEFHPFRRVVFFKNRLSRSVKESDLVIAVSKFTAKTLQEYFGLSEKKVKVVYNGYDKRRFKPYPKELVRTKIGKLGIYKDYILFLGTIEPRKNLLGLIEAHNKLPGYIRKSIPIVIVGGLGWKYEEIIDRLNDKCEKGELIYLGYVHDKYLPYLYSGALIFVYVSFFEGFGLPLLEAMACGTPVIASNTTSMPEVVGSAGILVDPKDTDAIAQAIMRMLDQEFVRRKYSAMSLARASFFSWENTALETMKLYYDLTRS